MAETFLTREYLKLNPNNIFVFGDNTIGQGYGGAAALRDEPNVYGFITKILPDNRNTSFYTPENYQKVFNTQFENLKYSIMDNPNLIFMISKLGAGLANKYGIWEAIICDKLDELKKFDNVEFLYEEEDK